MAVQGFRAELGEHKDLFQAGVDTIADGKIDQTESSSYGYGRFTAQFCQRIEAAALSSCHDDGCDIVHLFFSVAVFVRKEHYRTIPSVNQPQTLSLPRTEVKLFINAASLRTSVSYLGLIKACESAIHSIASRGTFFAL